MGVVLFSGKGRVLRRAIVKNDATDKYAPGTEHTYVSLNAPKFKTRIEIDGQDFRIAFENGTLKLNGPEAAAFDAVLHKPNSAVARSVRKVDKELGEKMALAHMEERAQVAAKGPFSSNQRMEMLHSTLKGRQVDMQRLATPEAAAKYAEELGGDMALQEIRAPSEVDKLAASIPVGAPAATELPAEGDKPAVESAGFKLNK
jgi:hypothetical protein